MHSLKRDPCRAVAYNHKVLIDRGLKGRFSGFVGETLDGAGELCGGLRVSYNPFYGYMVGDAVRGEVEHGGAYCVPHSGGLQGIWHTHPRGLCRASQVDLSTMKEDAERSVEGVVPGVPPLNIIATENGEGKLCFRSYVPSWSVSCRSVGGPYVYVVEDTGSGLMDDPWRFFRLISVEEVDDPLTGKVYYKISILGELDSDALDSVSGEPGAYIAHSVPPHARSVVLEFSRRFIGRRMWVLDEIAGLHRVEVLPGSPVVEELEASFASTELGRGERVKLLESEHGFPLSSVMNSVVAVFGSGFVGSRIAEAIAPYVRGLIIVDEDFVEEENIGYQALYGSWSLGAEKASMVAVELLARHSHIRVVPVRHKVPDGRSAPSSVVWSVVGSADIVVTAFDSMGPRLNVQLAANGLGKPLVDVSVGVEEAVVRAWIPRSGLACIGCYLSDSRAYESVSNTYASHPYLAWMASSVATWKIVSILSGRDSRGGVLRINLGEGEVAPKVLYEAIPEDKSCPYHSSEVDLYLTGSIEGVELKVRVREHPWTKLSNVAEKLEKILKGRWKVRIEEDLDPSLYSVAWVYRRQAGNEAIEITPSIEQS